MANSGFFQASNENRVIDKFLKVSEIDTTNFTLGLLFYFVLSFTRSFIALTISYVLNLEGMTETNSLLLALIPLTFIFLPIRFTKYFSSLIPILSLIWLSTSLLDDLLLKYILSLMGVTIAYVNLKYLIYLNKSPFFRPSVVWLILIDTGLRTSNNGTDPTIGYNFIGFIVILLFSIFVFIVLLFNRNSFKFLSSDFCHNCGTAMGWDDVACTNCGSKRPVNKNSNLLSSFSIIGFGLNLLMYFLFLGNAGIIVLSLGWRDLSAVSYFAYMVGAITLVSFLLYERIKQWGKLLVPMSSLVLIFSIFYYPWLDQFPLWSIGLFANLMLLFFTVDLVSNTGSIWFNISFAIVLVLAIGFMFMVIATDGSSFPLFSAIFASIFSLVTLFLGGSSRNAEVVV